MQLTYSQWACIEPHLLIGRCGPYPEWLRQQFDGVDLALRTCGQRREVPKAFGAQQSVHHCFRQGREAAGVFESLPEGLIAEAAKRGEVGAHRRKP